MAASRAKHPSGSYREREEYQLARALLAEICHATRSGPDGGATERLKRSAVALPRVFLPTQPQLSPTQERDSGKLLLDELSAALGSAIETGTLDEATAQRLDERRRVLLERIEEQA